MRTCLDPLGGPTGIVDKMIGNAFPAVQAVAANLRQIVYLAANMDAVVFAANQGLLANPERVAMLTGTTGALGQAITIPLPDGVTAAAIRSSSVLVTSTDGVIYDSYSGNFTTTISVEAGSLKLTLNGSSPVGLVNAVISWRLAYGV